MPAIHVQRSIWIDASVEKVFQSVVDFRTWTTWSPWLCSDPDAEVSVTDNATGVGAKYAWNGQVVGQGELTHRLVKPSQRIEDELHFVKPFKSRADTSFDFQPERSGCRVTWQMQSSLPWFLFWMKNQMQGFIGMDYDRGLRMLKEWLETGKILSRTTIDGVQTVGPIKVAGVRAGSAMSEVGSAMDKAFGTAIEQFTTAGLPKSGEMVSVYHKVNPQAMTFEFTAGYTVANNTNGSMSGLSTWSLPQTKALRVTHHGSYDHLGNAWSAAFTYARAKKLKLRGVGDFEIYRNSPRDTSAEDLCTEVYLPLR
jgi:effector-binding domain-containing protein